jgi:cytidylate kinase
MIIAVAGLTGSGKNTLGEEIAKQFNLRLVCPTFKDLAKKEGVSLMEFQKKASEDKEIDLKFDRLLKEESSKGNCVVTTWLGAWMVDADFRIYVYASERARAERIAKRDGMEISEALKHVKQRDGDNKKRYKKLYNIDITDTSSFDLVINSEGLAREQVSSIAIGAIKTAKLK